MQKIGNSASISINHHTGISMIKYHWNDEDDIIERGYSKTEILIPNISIPSGTNTLYITAIDDNNISTDASYLYSYDGIAIDLSVVNNTHMKIVASDITGMSYMKYRWNSGREMTVKPNAEGDISIEHLTEIPSGLNTLYVTAVNTSNITVDKEQNIKGIKAPEIEFNIVGTDLYVAIRDNEGVRSVTQKVNDEEPKTFNAGDQKVFTYRYYLGERNADIEITATDIEGASKTVTGKNY